LGPRGQADQHCGGDVARRCDRGCVAGLGRAGAYDVILAAYSLAAPLWQVANPPKKATDLPPDWNIDFTVALTRLIRATCAGLLAEPQKLEQG